MHLRDHLRLNPFPAADPANTTYEILYVEM